MKKKKLVKLVAINNTPSKLRELIVPFIGSFLIIVGIVLGFYTYGKSIRLPSPTTSTRIKPSSQYYDPLNLISEVKKNKSDIVFLDIRAAEEFQKEHIKNAISFPCYSLNNDTINYFDIQKTVKKMKIDKSKFIVVYGPSTSFQPQQTILSELKKNGYSAQLFAVGWNEFRHFQTIWIPEGLWGKIDSSTLIEKNY